MLFYPEGNKERNYLHFVSVESVCQWLFFFSFPLICIGVNINTAPPAANAQSQRPQPQQVSVVPQQATPTPVQATPSPPQATPQLFVKQPPGAAFFTAQQQQQQVE